MDYNLRVITPKLSLIVDKIESFHVETIAGEVTILPEHYPLISAIESSLVRFKKDGQIYYAFCGDGIVSVKEKEIVLTVSAFEYKDDIDIVRARAAEARAQERINNLTTDIDLKRARAALKRAKIRIKVSES